MLQQNRAPLYECVAMDGNAGHRPQLRKVCCRFDGACLQFRIEIAGKAAGGFGVEMSAGNLVFEM